MANSARSRRFTFTLNNYTEDDIERARQTALGGLVSYLVIGLETGEQGTPHFQGYLETTRKCVFRDLRQQMPFLLRAAIFTSRGDSRSNREYCVKDGNVLCEIGDPLQPGRRTDLEQIRQSIDNGVSELEISRDNFAKWCIYRRSFDAYRRLVAPRTRRLELTVQVYVGEPGTGKTRKVYDDCPDVYRVPFGGLWFDGYTGQRDVLFDDFDGDVPFRFLLQLLDIYPLDVPIKGGFVCWSPIRIFFTSNKSPDEWYPTERYGPLERRITEIKQFT